jgi:hypothetical protein
MSPMPLFRLSASARSSRSKRFDRRAVARWVEAHATG